MFENLQFTDKTYEDGTYLVFIKDPTTGKEKVGLGIDREKMMNRYARATLPGLPCGPDGKIIRN